jgi:hypothetical protein
MSLVEFSGSAGSFTTTGGRVRKVFVAGIILFGAAPADEPDASRAEELVLAAANAVLSSREAEGGSILEDLESDDTQYALGRRVEQRVVAELPERVTARVLELHVRRAEEAQPPEAAVGEPAVGASVALEPAVAEVAAPAELVAAEAAPESAAPAIGKGSRLYVAGSDGRWYPAMCLDTAPGYLLVDFGGGRVEWVGTAHCAPG